MKTRKEKDALGWVEVPVDHYGGSFTMRALENFQISELRATRLFKIALGWIKVAAAEVNAELGKLPKKHAKAIALAGKEFIEGKFDSHFTLDMYQAGAGTPFNMNVNEILANRANELLGGKKGEYKPVHPNNHVNMGQSSNDVIPTAIRIATLKNLESFMKAGKNLVKTLETKSKQFNKAWKVGRTHLQDAVPVTLGQEFSAYASSVKHALERVDVAQKELRLLGIGGTAIGSGLTAHPKFAQKMCSVLSQLSGLRLSPAPNRFETTHSMAAFLAVSSALRGLATELLRISNDLRLMASGPVAGFNEIQLPEVEPGSSIMPGKVNPSILECLSMICIQVMGLDHAIALAAQQGQFELNWHTPLIAADLLHQIEILTHGMEMFDTRCVQGIKANTVEMKRTLESSAAMATALLPELGYAKVAELVKEAKGKNMPFAQLLKLKRPS